jgi:hypothetical protein
MKSTFRSSLNKIAAKVRNNINDLRDIRTAHRREKSAKHYDVADKAPEPQSERVTNKSARQHALAKHRRQIARDKRRQNRHQGKGKKVQGRGH